MANIVTWNGSSTFATGQTPFGFYDTDSSFQTDADKVASFCAQRLGYPLMDVELQSGSFYACFEEAVTTYGNEVFQYKIRENYLNIQGAPTGSSLNNKVVQPNLTQIVEISKNYGTEAEVGGNVTKYTGSLAISASRQNYDLDAWAAASASLDTGDSIEVRKIFYEAPPAILRYFDPYAGTGTGVQSLMDAFDFGGFSPGINFLLMPTSYDALKLQAIEFNDQIRRSGYSFELVNNQLKIFPIPKNSGKLYFEYYKLSDKKDVTPNDSVGNVSTVAEVPYSNPQYTQINSVGRQWIFQYTLALAKEILGYIRGKYQVVPVPGSEATLNQADLLADARTEKENLLTQLRDTLEQTSRSAQLERQATESDNLRKTLSDVPYTIYIG
jgi:hypothetical protein|tara:strand:- start:5168 stop:6319 length:1152 start_codon:yes stop_codon:yes gene_type:complete